MDPIIAQDRLDHLHTQRIIDLVFALEVISLIDMRPPKRRSGSTRGEEKSLNSTPLPLYLCGKDFPDRVPPQRQ